MKSLFCLLFLYNNLLLTNGELIVGGNSIFAMGHLKVFESREACQNQANGLPYMIQELVGFKYTTSPLSDPLLFTPGQCVGFSLNPLNFIRVAEDCASFKLYSGYGCLSGEVTDYNTCGQDASQDKAGKPFYSLDCSLFGPKEVAELTVGCKLPAGVISMFIAMNTCLSDKTAQSMQIVATDATSNGVTLQFYDRSYNCSDTTSVNKTKLNPDACSDISAVAGSIADKYNQGLRVSIYEGAKSTKPVVFGNVENLATFLVGAGIGAGVAAGVAGGAASSSGGGLEIVLLGQMIARNGQMHLPYAPPEYMNFASSLGWTCLSFNIFGGSSTNSSSSTLRLLQEKSQDLLVASGFDAYLRRVGVNKDKYFISVFVVYIILHVVAAMFIGMISYFRSRNLENAKDYMKSASMTIGYIMFYPILLAVFYEIWLQTTALSKSALASTLAAFTAIASIVFCCLLIWMGYVARKLYMMTGDELVQRKPKIVYGVFYKKMRQPMRNFWMLNFAILLIETGTVIFVRTDPFFVQPAILMCTSFLTGILHCCLRPYEKLAVNRFNIGISILFFLSSLIPVIWSIEPVIFDAPTMATLGTVEMALNLGGIALTFCLILIEAGPRMKAWISGVISGKSLSDEESGGDVEKPFTPTGGQVVSSSGSTLVKSDS